MTIDQIQQLRAELSRTYRERDKALAELEELRTEMAEHHDQDGGDDSKWCVPHRVLNLGLAERDQARAELANLSLAVMDADLYCWGPAYDPERAKEAAHRLRLLAQPNRDRSNTAWVLLDRWRKDAASAPALRDRDQRIAERVRERAAKVAVGLDTGSGVVDVDVVAAAIRAIPLEEVDE